ncbi:MAG: hypothetical protein AVDCRST_MAG18-1514, partial [uncultured Thermomicrobiales bacterium]
GHGAARRAWGAPAPAVYSFRGQA